MSDLTDALTIAVNRACNACVLGDRRLTEWERNFLCDLMDRRIVDDVTRLTANQCAAICDIADKCHNVPAL